MPSADEVVQPARFFIGPPAPAWFSLVARGLSLTLLIIVGHWVQAYLGGVAVRPTPTDTGNDTSKLFNWHPILMTLGFGVFMTEAVLTYQAPLLPSLPREARKRIHWVCHSCAAFCIFFGLTASLQSHNLKLPTPIPNLYSPHSILGLTTVLLALAQFLGGLYAYLWPKAPLPTRVALGPVHRFTGAAIWVCGLATMASGLQEKSTFIQMGKGLSGDALYGGIIRLPAMAQVVLVLLGLFVLYHQVPPAQPVGAQAKEERQGLLSTQEVA